MNIDGFFLFFGLGGRGGFFNKLCPIRDLVCLQKLSFALLRTFGNWSLCTAFVGEGGFFNKLCPIKESNNVCFI